MASMTEVIEVVDRLFEAADKENLDAGDIRRDVESHFGLDSSSALKMTIKARLRDLMTGRAKLNVITLSTPATATAITPEKDITGTDFEALSD
jgi:hypothetical protein